MDYLILQPTTFFIDSGEMNAIHLLHCTGHAILLDST